jgi:hypothetical protein
MRYFVTINNAGRIIGRYDLTVHRAAPESAIPVSLAIWETTMQNPGDYRYDSAAAEWLIDPPVVEPVALSTLISRAQTLIDQAAGEARLRYITDVAGQDATYLEKARQADSYKAADYPDPPDPVAHIYIVAEKNARGGDTTYRQACDAILVERDQWAVKGAQIEEARRKSKIAIGNALDQAAVEGFLAEGINALRLM